MAETAVASADVQGWKIYSDGEVQWFAARSLEEAQQVASEYDCELPDAIEQLEAADLDGMKFREDEPDPALADEDGERVITFRQRLTELVEAGGMTAQFFAGED